VPISRKALSPALLRYDGISVEFSAARFESNINKQSRKRVVMLREGRMSVKLAEMEALVLFEL
jgi:hypothetical protein